MHDTGVWKTIKIILFIIAILLLVFLAFKSLFYLAPFIIAFAISSLIEPIVRLLITRLRLPRKAASPITLLLVLSIVGFLLFLLVSRLVAELVNLSYSLPRYFSEMYDTASTFVEKASDLYLWLPPEVTKNAAGIISNLTSTLMNLLNSFFKGLLNTATSLPQVLIFIIVTIVSTYFLSSDRERIFGYFKSHLPDTWVAKIQSIFYDLFSALFGYLRAQLILMTITFTELCIGFTIIGVGHPILMALFTSFVDALPVLGTGSVLVPWAIYNVLTGNFRMAISLVVIYGIALVVRQMVEPKVLSQQIGVHPLLTLMAMYVGLKLFGIPGLILGPITVLVLKNVLSGLIKNTAVKELLSKIRVPR